MKEEKYYIDYIKEALALSVDKNFQNFTDVLSEQYFLSTNIFSKLELSKEELEKISQGRFNTKEEPTHFCTRSLRYNTFKDEMDDKEIFRMVTNYNEEMDIEDSVFDKIFFKLFRKDYNPFSSLTRRKISFILEDDRLKTFFDNKYELYYGDDLGSSFRKYNCTCEAISTINNIEVFCDIKEKYLYEDTDKNSFVQRKLIRCEENPNNIYGYVNSKESNVFFIKKDINQPRFHDISLNNVTVIDEQTYNLLSCGMISTDNIIKRKELKNE